MILIDEKREGIKKCTLCTNEQKKQYTYDLLHCTAKHDKHKQHMHHAKTINNAAVICLDCLAWHMCYILGPSTNNQQVKIKR